MSRRKAIWILVGCIFAVGALFFGLLMWLAAAPMADWSAKNRGTAHSAASDQASPSAADPAFEAGDDSPEPTAWDAQIREENPLKRAALRSALSMVTWSPASMRGEGDGGLAHKELFSKSAQQQLESDAADGPLMGGEWMERAEDEESSVGQVELIEDEPGGHEHAEARDKTKVWVYATWKWVPSNELDADGEWSPWARILYLTMAKEDGEWVVDGYEWELVARSDYELPQS